jgi:hypothetical protein
VGEARSSSRPNSFLRIRSNLLGKGRAECPMAAVEKLTLRPYEPNLEG